MTNQNEPRKSREEIRYCDQGTCGACLNELELLDE